MPILIFFIIFSISFYVFYKAKYVRSRRPIERQWISSKSSIALGTFILFFGINQLFLYSQTITYVIATLFILLGLYNIVGGIRAYRYYFPLAVEELEKEKATK